jgi:hypothetical protein
MQRRVENLCATRRKAMILLNIPSRIPNFSRIADE